MSGPVVGSLRQPVWGYKGIRGIWSDLIPLLARAKWAWRASPLPLSLEEEEEGGSACRRQRQVARQAAALGPAMGGFTAATGTFHHSVRGAAAKQQFKFTLLASANSRVDNPSSAIVTGAVPRARRINQADNLEPDRQIDGASR